MGILRGVRFFEMRGLWVGIQSIDELDGLCC